MTVKSQNQESAPDSPDEKPISCKWCEGDTHHVGSHFIRKKCSAIPTEHKGKTPEELIRAYVAQFPEAPTMSAAAAKKLKEKEAEKKSVKEAAVVGYAGFEDYMVEKVAVHEVMGLDPELLMSASGEPLRITVNINKPFPEFVPKAKSDYVFGDIDLLKDVLMMIEMGMPGYLWGHAGTGKSTLPTQICARLNRPIIRSQHTASTEESHICGQILVKNGATYFEPGLLASAMRNGWVYLADEYDFAYPQILGVYQPVLEGEPLIIKEATPEWRYVEPHKRFAFIGTGNTNGSGDETGLYQGTNIQNAANFSRFGIVSHVKYMSVEQERLMLEQMGLPKAHATMLVDFATRIRNGYEAGSISQPIGPRELRNAAMLGMAHHNFRKGVTKSFINKLPSTSALAATEMAQRVFGDG
ncbi:AAA family ATPase [Klebsiella michiganensis]|uniref:AAA family ATPase n=1 Tax=Klebsiella TaxID=570 RepID=UPI00092DE71A|nr:MULTISPECIES: AAA family ATPase [Klebsiella]APM29161.1 porphyrin biosynthesis protein [Klebsiella oxytoca]EKX4892426.1 AAA family ATPase [Raoultella ornithinolytica]ELK6574880.1 AAA family ATPase [Klebsiella michiganensis]HDS7121646.1 AAA family ATPase [Klebsiella michiganensis]